MRETYGVGIVVAGGSGTRMTPQAGDFPAGPGRTMPANAAGKNGKSGISLPVTKKQYMDLAGKPLMYYAVNAMEQSALIDGIVIVVSPGDEAYVKQEIVERFALSKVWDIVPGGKERYHSVYAGLQAVVRQMQPPDGDDVAETYVYIQDAARPFLTEDILRRVYDGVTGHGACVAAMPVKDTVKQADENGFVTGTPDRRSLRAMQTPQAFRLSLIHDAYNRFMQDARDGKALSQVTDDAMVLERYHPGQRIVLVEGSYGNIKVTTPEDLVYAKAMMQNASSGEAG